MQYFAGLKCWRSTTSCTFEIHVLYLNRSSLFSLQALHLQIENLRAFPSTYNNLKVLLKIARSRNQPSREKKENHLLCAENNTHTKPTVYIITTYSPGPKENFILTLQRNNKLSAFTFEITKKMDSIFHHKSCCHLVT